MTYRNALCVEGHVPKRFTTCLNLLNRLLYQIKFNHCLVLKKTYFLQVKFKKNENKRTEKSSKLS